MRTILSTVGTSLLKARDKTLPNLVELLFVLNSTDPRKACAETNALSHLLKDGDRLIFLHSETEEGKLCAQALKTHYERKGYEATFDVIPHLSYRETHFRSQGLRSLVGKLVECIRNERAQGREVLINATGGFKAEGAYATLVGLLFDVPVYYIHEVFQEIVRMPAIPIDWDYSLLAEYEEFFRFLHQDLRSRYELEKKLSALPQKIRSLLEEEENFVMLSPAGEAFFQAYLAKVDQVASLPVEFSPEAWRSFERADGTVQERVRNLLRKLKLKEVRQNCAKALRNLSCFVYPQGHQSERVLFCEHGNRIRVCAIVSHSDKSYEALLERGISCENARSFLPFPG